MNIQTQTPPPWWFLPGFVLLWCIVAKILVQLSGWTSVAKVYPHTGPLPRTNRWDFCSIPNLTMSHCVHVAVDKNGMYFRLWLFFRLGNPSIFVPWSDISVSNSHFLFVPTARISFKKIPEVAFQFYAITANKFADAEKNRWPSP
jgi:hypothetical protein